MVLHHCSKRELSRWLQRGGTSSGEQGVWCWACIVDHGVQWVMASGVSDAGGRAVQLEWLCIFELTVVCCGL
jgi:hypothetical protein